MNFVRARQHTSERRRHNRHCRIHPQHSARLPRKKPVTGEFLRPWLDGRLRTVMMESLVDAGSQGNQVQVVLVSAGPVIRNPVKGEGDFNSRIDKG
jgi:hypothetical protein